MGVDAWSRPELDGGLRHRLSTAHGSQLTSTSRAVRDQGLEVHVPRVVPTENLPLRCRSEEADVLDNRQTRQLRPRRFSKGLPQGGVTTGGVTTDPSSSDGAF